MKYQVAQKKIPDNQKKEYQVTQKKEGWQKKKAGWAPHGPGLVHLDQVAQKGIRDNPKKEYQVTQKKKASWAPHGPRLVHLGHRTAWAGLHRRVRLGHEAASLLFLGYLAMFLG